jgi:thymidylate synthase
LSQGFPLVTTKELHIKSIVHELIWFLKGDTHIDYLIRNGVNIWNDWPYDKYKKSDQFQGETMKEFLNKLIDNPDFSKKWGDLGPVYGKQWRNWTNSDGQSVDQIAQLLHSLKHNPNSRRHIVSAWNPLEIEQMALPPCHCLFQFYVVNNTLSCQLYQRSADAFLGVPFNIASYSLLVFILANILDYEVGEFVHTFGDVHLYQNHLDQVKTQLSRDPLPLPSLKIKRKLTQLSDIKFEDFEFIDYVYHPKLKAPVAV